MSVDLGTYGLLVGQGAGGGFRSSAQIGVAGYGTLRLTRPRPRSLDPRVKSEQRLDKETVLIVDDEEMVLTSLSTYLALETDYEVATFTSAGRALEHIQQNEVGIIISDFLMPEMDGITFLARARELRPDAPRVILTGYADKENAIKAINLVGLYQYVEKPWDNDEIRLVIRNGLEKKQLLAKLTQKVSQINDAYSELQGIQQEILKAFA